jgi:5,10-methylenetetrahydromethanopterin reductase
VNRPRELSIAFQTDKQPHEYRELARVTEEYGFDVLSMYSDLTYQPPIVPLTIAAMATSRLRLGPASLNPFTLHPIEIAGQIATLDAVSQGRAYLGISRGAWLDAIGVEQHRPVARVIDTVRAVRHLLAGEARTFNGRTFTMGAEVQLRYQPFRSQIPLLVGTWGPRLAAAAGPFVDEIKLGGSANPAMVARATTWFTGRQPGIVAGAVTVVDEDGWLARNTVRREMALYLPVVAPLDPTVSVEPELLERIASLAQQGEIEQAGRQISDDLLHVFAFAGTPVDIIDQCEALFDAGASRIEFGTPHGRTAATGLELLGNIVLPALRAEPG